VALVIDFLSQNSLFENLPIEDLKNIQAHISRQRHVRGTTIYSEFDKSDSLYLIIEGIVKIQSVNEKGEESIILVLSKGDIFGLFLLTDERRPFSAIAQTDVTVVSLSKRFITESLITDPRFDMNLMKILSRRLLSIENSLKNFGHTWSYTRLARTLLKLSSDFGTESPDGIMISSPFTHADLANLIGTSRETVTKQLNRLEALGVIKRNGRRIFINSDAIQELLQQ